MNMDIVIIATFTGDFSISDNNRFLFLAKMLCEHNKVELITSSFFHDTKKQRVKREYDYPFIVTFIKEPGYPKNICLRRFFSHHVWGKNVIKYIKQRVNKPDVIYCAVPSLTGPNLISEYCEKEGIKFVVDVQDLWPEAFRMVFNAPIVSDIVFSPFSYMVNRIYKNADVVCGVSRTYVDRALRSNIKNTNGHVVFLGTDLSDFDRNARNNPVKKPEGELWLGYCGTLGTSYDLTVVIDALDILKNRGITIPKFIILGDGPRRDEFELQAKQKKVDCFFAGQLPYDRMCGWLTSCDIVVNPIVAGSAASIINKHGDYASAGRPVLNTQDSSEYRALVTEYQMGFNCRNSDASDLAKKLSLLITDPTLRLMMGNNARRCAEEKFDREKTYKELVDCILN